MPKLHTALDPGAVILIPAGSGASIRFIEKSGKRSRVVIESDTPVTVTQADEQPTNSSGMRLAKRPLPTPR